MRPAVDRCGGKVHLSTIQEEHLFDTFAYSNLIEFLNWHAPSNDARETFASNTTAGTLDDGIPTPPLLSFNIHRHLKRID